MSVRIRKHVERIGGELDALEALAVHQHRSLLATGSLLLSLQAEACTIASKDTSEDQREQLITSFIKKCLLLNVPDGVSSKEVREYELRGN